MEITEEYLQEKILSILRERYKPVEYVKLRPDGNRWVLTIHLYPKNSNFGYFTDESRLIHNMLDRQELDSEHMIRTIQTYALATKMGMDDPNENGNIKVAYIVYFGIL